MKSQLNENHATSPGVWLQLSKKSADTPSVSYEEAIEIALCFGWIDGQKQTHSEQFWLQKFTRRSNKSVWSKINKDKALALIKTAKMKPAGLKEIERAKIDGRWDVFNDAMLMQLRGWGKMRGLIFLGLFLQPRYAPS